MCNRRVPNSSRNAAKFGSGNAAARSVAGAAARTAAVAMMTGIRLANWRMAGIFGGVNGTTASVFIRGTCRRKAGEKSVTASR